MIDLIIYDVKIAVDRLSGGAVGWRSFSGEIAADRCTVRSLAAIYFWDASKK